jgi:hypothetical protein
MAIRSDIPAPDGSDHRVGNGAGRRRAPHIRRMTCAAFVTFQQCALAQIDSSIQQTRRSIDQMRPPPYRVTRSKT